MKILFSAYLCRPGQGSEASIGWNTPIEVARGHDVWVLTSSASRSAIAEAVANEPIDRVNHIIVELPPRFERLNHQLRYLLWLVYSYATARRLNRSIGFDVAQHISYVRYWTPSLLPLLPVPYVWGPIAGHEPAHIRLVEGLTAKAKEYVRRVILMLANVNPLLWYTARKSAVVLACSDEMERHAKTLGARRTQKMIPSPPLGDVFELTRRTSGPAPIGEFIDLVSVAGVQRVFDWKGYHLALHGIAASGLRNIRYRIYGSGPHEAVLRRLARDLGIEQMVEFVGDVPRSEMLLAMRDSVALLHPALRDGGATVIVEAMAMGVPSICLDSGGPALQLDAETGFLVDPTSVESVANGIAEAIRKLANDPDLRQKMFDASRARASKHFTWQVRGEELRQVYRTFVQATAD